MIGKSINLSFWEQEKKIHTGFQTDTLFWVFKNNLRYSIYSIVGQHTSRLK